MVAGEGNVLGIDEQCDFKGLMQGGDDIGR